MNLSKDLIAASSTPLVLGILAEGESYGYQIVRRVDEVSGGRLKWTDGMMYPLLHRLEQQGLLKSVWRTAETGRRRKYYRITARGRDSLKLHRQHWELVNDALNEIWRELSEASRSPGAGGAQPA